MVMLDNRINIEYKVTTRLCRYVQIFYIICNKLLFKSNLYISENKNYIYGNIQSTFMENYVFLHY